MNPGKYSGSCTKSSPIQLTSVDKQMNQSLKIIIWQMFLLVSTCLVCSARGQLNTKFSKHLGHPLSYLNEAANSSRQHFVQHILYLNDQDRLGLLSAVQTCPRAVSRHFQLLLVYC